MFSILTKIDPGHVNTYKDVASGKTLDYGVQIFYNNTATTSYFEHFDIPLVSVGSGEGAGGAQNLFNFKANTDFPEPDAKTQQELLAPALGNYSQQLAKYPYLAETFDLPDPVPEDLTIPFGEFSTKYGLLAAVLPAHLYNQIGNIIKLPTLYVMKAFSAIQVQTITNAGFVANGLQNNQLLYDKAQAELGSNVFVESKVTHIVRKETEVEVYFDTPSGKKVVKACKLLIAIPPTAKNLEFLDADDNEKEIFGTFTYNYYFDTVLNNTGIPANQTLVNVGGLDTQLAPELPATYVLRPSTIEGIQTAYYGTYSPTTSEQAGAAIIEAIEKVRKTLGYPEPKAPTKVIEIHNHAPYELVVTGEQIKQGFYKKLEALQGAKKTWFTGAAWKTHASSEIWDFNEKHIIPELLK